MSGVRCPNCGEMSFFFISESKTMASCAGCGGRFEIEVLRKCWADKFDRAPRIKGALCPGCGEFHPIIEGKEHEWLNDHECPGNLIRPGDLDGKPSFEWMDREDTSNLVPPKSGTAARPCPTTLGERYDKDMATWTWRHAMHLKIMELEARVAALRTRELGMVTANHERERKGEALAYAEEAFVALAEDMTKLADEMKSIVAGLQSNEHQKKVDEMLARLAAKGILRVVPKGQGKRGV